MLGYLSLAAVVVATSHAFLIDSLVKQEKWDGLKVTWGANPFSSSYFVNMPRTVPEATSQGWHKISDCDTSAAWRGARYIKGSDYAVILLFDVNGYIAGIQTSFKDNQKNGYPKPNNRPPFVKDGDRVTLSAYFVDPSIICTTGRTEKEIETQGTGTNLYLQKTSNPERSTLIPFKENGMATTKWTKGKCFIMMGTHYWLDLKEDMNCDDFYPTFLMYNSGELTGFGWALNTGLSSPRYEHPGKSAFEKFMNPVPKCLYDAGALSTMHIYLTAFPYKNLCIF